MAIDPIPSKFLGMIHERNIKKSTYPSLSTVIFGGRKKKDPHWWDPSFHRTTPMEAKAWDFPYGKRKLGMDVL